MDDIDGIIIADGIDSPKSIAIIITYYLNDPGFPFYLEGLCLWVTLAVLRQIKRIAKNILNMFTGISLKSS